MGSQQKMSSLKCPKANGGGRVPRHRRLRSAAPCFSREARPLQTIKCFSSCLLKPPHPHPMGTAQSGGPCVHLKLQPLINCRPCVHLKRQPLINCEQSHGEARMLAWILLSPFKRSKEKPPHENQSKSQTTQTSVDPCENVD